jgi:hypothetical protein
MSRCLRVAVAVLLLGLTACEKEAEPPAADAKICGVTMASWWFDATGAPGLVGTMSGAQLPIEYPADPGLGLPRAECRVFSEGKQIGDFTVRLRDSAAADNVAGQVESRPKEQRFTAAGGQGAVDETGDGVTGSWVCKTTVLYVELTEPKDKDTRLDLMKPLAQHLAGIAGCPELPSAG